MISESGKMPWLADGQDPQAEKALTAIRGALMAIQNQFDLINSAVDLALSADFLEVKNLARLFEKTMRKRSRFEVAVAEAAMSEKGADAIGTRATLTYLSDCLGISRQEAAERIDAARIFGDIEPIGDGSNLTPDAFDQMHTQSTECAQRTVDECTGSDELEAARRIVMRAESELSIKQAMVSGAVSTWTLSSVSRAVQKLLPNAGKCAEEIKSEVVSEFERLTADQLVGRARQLVREANGQVPKQDLFADQRRRALWLTRPDRFGNARLTWIMDKASLVKVKAVLAAHSIKGAGIELPEGQEDQRLPVQRNSDAMSMVLSDFLRGAKRGQKGIASLVVVADAKDFSDCSSNSRVEEMQFQTNVGETLNAAQLGRLELADRAFGVVIDTQAGMAPIDMTVYAGNRLGNALHRMMLQVIDGCCQFPNCDRPIAECDVHHLVAAYLGGETVIENLVPLCRAHHVQNDDSRNRLGRGYMADRTPRSNFRSGWQSAADAEDSEPKVKYNTGWAAREAYGYVDPPNQHDSPSQQQRAG